MRRKSNAEEAHGTQKKRFAEAETERLRRSYACCVVVRADGCRRRAFFLVLAFFFGFFFWHFVVPLCGHCVNRNKKRCEIISELGPTRKWCLSSVDKLSLPRPSTSHAKGLLLYCFVCIANVLPMQWPAIEGSDVTLFSPRPSTLDPGFLQQNRIKRSTTHTHTHVCVRFGWQLVNPDFLVAPEFPQQTSFPPQCSGDCFFPLFFFFCCSWLAS